MLSIIFTASSVVEPRLVLESFSVIKPDSQVKYINHTRRKKRVQYFSVFNIHSRTPKGEDPRLLRQV